MIFLAKKVIGALLSPLSIVLVIASMGLLLVWFTRKQRPGKVLLTVAVGLLGLMSYGQVANMMARPLEHEYPPLTDFQTLKNIKWIVVLGGGSGVDPGLPRSTYLSEASLVRLSEAVFIHNRLPQAKLILTGRSGFEGITPVAEVMADTAEEWGVEPEDIVLETKATDTKDHPIYVKEIVGEDRFILVTSASHMLRAMALFRKHGMEPIPAPTDYMVKEREGGLRLGMFFPSAGSLEKAGRAIHEYLGMAWAKMRSQI